MKKLDVFVVRYLPIFLFIEVIVVIANCWNGVNNLPFSYLHSNSFFYAFALFVVSLADKRYHCVWNRAMYVELMVIPVINYVDAKWNVFPDAYSMLLVLTSTIALTLIVTLFFAIRHFVKPRIKKYGCQR